jgi:hypothetical protein
MALTVLLHEGRAESQRMENAPLFEFQTAIGI